MRDLAAGSLERLDAKSPGKSAGSGALWGWIHTEKPDAKRLFNPVWCEPHFKVRTNFLSVSEKADRKFALITPHMSGGLHFEQVGKCRIT